MITSTAQTTAVRQGTTGILPVPRCADTSALRGGTAVSHGRDGAIENPPNSGEARFERTSVAQAFLPARGRQECLPHIQACPFALCRQSEAGHVAGGIMPVPRSGSSITIICVNLLTRTYNSESRTRWKVSIQVLNLPCTCVVCVNSNVET